MHTTQMRSCHPVVAAGDQATAAAGASVLSAGGSAVDAAIAATWAACVAEPVLTSIFGGGYALVDAPQVGSHAFDFFARVPGLENQKREGSGSSASSTPLDFRGVDVWMGSAHLNYHIGRGAAAVPLLLPGLFHLHERYGCVPLPTLLAPAIQLARHGTPMSKGLAQISQVVSQILLESPESRAQFAPNGPILTEGDIFIAPQFAEWLEDLTSNPQDNRWGDALLKGFGTAVGGCMTDEDLRAARVVSTQPLLIRLSTPLSPHVEIALNPPPSSGGLLIAFGLKTLARVPERVWQDPVATLQHLLAAMATIQAAREAVLDDVMRQGSDALQREADAFLDDAHIRSWQPYFRHALHGRLLDGGPPEPSSEVGSTTHISAVDETGMVCAITSSNGEGCGYMAPNCGVMVNNFMGEADLHPNGFFSRPAGERLTSMMCPTLVRVDGTPRFALGTGGSSRIRTALLQVLTRILFCKQSVEEAVRAPRLHYAGHKLYVETQAYGTPMPATFLDGLSARVHDLITFDEEHLFFGGVHSCDVYGGGVGDPRRSGAVATPNKQQIL